MKPELDVHRKIQGKEEKGEVLTSYAQKEAAAFLSAGFFPPSFLLNFKYLYIINSVFIWNMVG